MRFLVLSLLVSFVAGKAVADELADCARIGNAAERLACYDRLAGSQAQGKSGETPAPPGSAPSAPSQPEPLHATSEERAATERRQQAPSTARAPEAPAPAAPNGDGLDARELFGKETRWKPVGELDHIDARIEAVRKAPLGEHVMTLSNGQIWMENEPGRRAIRAGQDVTITRHRWHFEMELPSRPNVAVHRVQ